jgi:restriction system protein
MSNSNVEAAIEILLEEIELEINHITESGAKALEARDFDRAGEVLENAKVLTVFRNKVASLRAEWDSLVPKEVERKKVVGVNRRDLGRIKKGIRTSEEQFYLPILQVLNEMSGSGRIGDVLNRLGKIMGSVLKKVDYETLSDKKTIRWMNTAQWARNSMAADGRLKSKSPRGVWEISDKGRKFLEKSYQK